MTFVAAWLLEIKQAIGADSSVPERVQPMQLGSSK